MEFQKNTHHVYRLMYHFVWVKKYRHKVFSEPYRSALKGTIEKVVNANEQVIRAYVQSQLTEYEKREARAEQLGLF